MLMWLFLLALIASLAWLICLAVRDFKALHAAAHRRLAFEACESRIVLTPIASVSAMPATEGGEIWVTVQVDSLAEGAAEVDVEVSGLTATEGDDYYVVGEDEGVYTTTVSFGQGEWSKDVYIGTVDDELYEGDETLQIDLTNSLGLTLSETQSSVITQIVDDEINSWPTTNGISDQFRWVEDEDEIVIDLRSHFFDGNDPISSFSWGITTSGESGLASTSVDSCQFLHLTFSTGTAGVSNIIVRGTDPHGGWAETDFGSYSVAVTDFDLERKENGSWISVDPESEVLWDDDELRWTATMDPYVPSIVAGLGWLASPWPGQNYPSGTSFASSIDLQPAIGNPGMGNHAVTPQIMLPNAKAAYLAAPTQVVVASVTSVKWKQHDYGDNEQDYFSAGHMMFAERPSAAIGAVVHDRIDVEVTVMLPDAGKDAQVFLQEFDPDHHSGWHDFDTNGDLPDDNISGPNVPDTELTPTPLTFTSGGAATKTATLKINARQPGNNFIVAASGRPEKLNAFIFQFDGVTLLQGVQQPPVSGSHQTPILTIWRTLNVEQDSMDAPHEIFPGEFTEAGVGNDDVFPGNPGTGGEAGGAFAQPSLAWLTSEMARANVYVRVLGLEDDFNDDAEFIHNLGGPAPYNTMYGNAVRDVSSHNDFWVIQVFAAYEWLQVDDFDPPPLAGPEDGELGNTNDQSDHAPINVFLETIRDVSVSFPDAVDSDRIRQRTVLHEAMHRFGHEAHDVGIMLFAVVVTGSDEENELTQAMLREIALTFKP